MSEIFNSLNCQSCAEFEDNLQPTELCKICQCFNCKENRRNCFNKGFCFRDNVPIEFA